MRGGQKMGAPSGTVRILRFGVFELELEEQHLRKAGALLHIRPQPLKVLTILASRPGKLVTREELQRELWGDETFVDFEQGLNYCIRQIRTILGDEAQTPRYIETVPRRGYRFIAAVNGIHAATGDEALVTSDAGKKPGFRFKWILLVIVAALAFSVVTYFVLGGPSRRSLTERDSILIAELSNATGDPLFDGTLRRAVSVDLAQSPYLNIVSDEKISQVLGLMGKPRETRITPEVGREICLRSGAKALLTGSIATLGTRYVLTIQVFHAATGETLAEQRVQADSKEQVLNVLGRAADRLREKLGESLASIQQFGKPLELVTTTSLEALQLYTLGVEKRSEGDYEAIPFFQRAIQIDPDFALAHATLGTAYMNLEQLQLAEEHERKALALSDRVTEKERLYITAHYYLLIGQKEKEILTYETYARLYPNDSLPEGNLANEYNVLGRFDKAVGHALKAIQLAPDFAGNYGEAADAYEGLGRIEDAKKIVAEGLRRSPGSTYLHHSMSNIALAENDSATQEREDGVLHSTPYGNLDVLYRDAALAASRGKLLQAQGLYEQAAQMALKLGLKDNASFAWALRSVYEAYLHKPSDAKLSAKKALDLSEMSDTIEPAAVALAVAGDEKQAEALIDKLSRNRPEDEIVQFVWVPTIHALVSMNQGNPEQAVRDLNPALPYDRGNLDPMLARANAFLQARRLPEALREFGNILSLRMHSPYDPACSMAQLGLARAYALDGQKDPSRKAYEEFLTLWQDADPDIPILKQAKAEYAKLQ